MTTEEKLKEYILQKYGTIKRFSAIAGIPNGTMANILRRGIMNSSVDNIIAICRTLEISVDELADGRITPLADREKLNEKITYLEFENSNLRSAAELAKDHIDRMLAYAKKLNAYEEKEKSAKG